MEIAVGIILGTIAIGFLFLMGAMFLFVRSIWLIVKSEITQKGDWNE